MKNVKSIFAKFLMVSVMLMVVVKPTFADNGCEDDNNDAISAEFALCSTHVYNIGDTENPDSTQRDLMNDVVAMKSELITQQMYRHYEQMESMLRRFKTQLEKAVLTSNLQAAGASKNSDDSPTSSSWRNADKSVYMSVGVTNCLNIYDDEKILECYQNNLNSIVSQSGNGNKPTREIKQQLANDLSNLSSIKFGDSSGCDSIEDNCKDQEKIKKISAQEFRTCLNEARTCLQNQTRQYKNQQLKLQSNK